MQKVVIYLLLFPIAFAFKCGNSKLATKKYGQIIDMNHKIDVDETDRILGGDESIEGRWPWIVHLVSRNDSAKKEFSCTASIIGNRWIMTAAHCVKDKIAGKSP